MQHKNLASGRWHKLSLLEQMGNIGSEVHRALVAKNKDEKRFEDSVLRVLELLDLTLQDARHRKRLKELTRVREVFCDTIYGTGEYGVTHGDLDSYFFHFALAARK